MNKDIFEGNWKQLKGSIQKKWGKLTDDDLDVIAGKLEMMSGKIQELYGISKDKADEELKDWEKNYRPSSG